jgi:hypothetical protein
MLFPDVPAWEVAWVCAPPTRTLPAGGNQPGGDVLVSWAEGLASRREAVRGRGACGSRSTARGALRRGQGGRMWLPDQDGFRVAAGVSGQGAVDASGKVEDVLGVRHA